MKTLTNTTALLKKNSPEFLQDLQENIIDPIEKLGAKFQGYGSMANNKEQAGVHILIFDMPHDLSKEKHQQIIELAEYEDEGTNSTNYLWFGTLYILIPMPF